jgi:RimJ/RimL family protein N-acetyltransferase
MGGTEMDLRPPVLEGVLVRVEPLAAQHEQGLWLQADDPEIWRYLPLDGGVNPQAFAEWFRSDLAQAERSDVTAFAVIDRDAGLAVGHTRYHAIRPEHRRLEIGFTWYGRRYWGTGINVETKLLLLGHAFETLGYHRVEFKTDARNARSRGALEALPAQYEGTFRSHMLVRGGRRRDSVYYSIIDSDWPVVRINLERRLECHLEARLERSSQLAAKPEA